MSAFLPYAPLNTPKAFGPGLWIVDGPEIRMDYGPDLDPLSNPDDRRAAYRRHAVGSLAGRS